ncbi:MAG: ABC transporter substrate-binding protein [Bacillota bacterium]|nr:ABC transporter substrate-binding protein [Bacillota bacterium]
MKKKNVKKLLLPLCLILTLCLVLAGCGGQAEEDVAETAPPAEPVSVVIAGLAGPTSIGMIQLISGQALNSDAYAVEYMVAEAPDALTGKLINGEIQIAALPTNTAAVLFNRTEGGVQFLAQNTLGVLYVVGSPEAGVSSLADLAGKTVAISGAGGVPQYAVEYILSQNGLTEQVTLNYLPDHATVAQTLLAGDAEVAVLPQPFVTQVLNQNENLSILLDVTEEWTAASGGESVLSMGCLVVEKTFAEENPQFIADFLELYQASVNFANEEPAAAAALVEQEGIIASAAVVEQAIPYCNIVYKSAQDAKEEIGGFLTVLYESDPASVGGTLPDDSFYYEP